MQTWNGTKDVKSSKFIWILSLALAGCSAKEPLAEQADVVGTPVLFSSGNMAEARTKADDPLGSTSPYYLGITNTSGVPYMPQNGRFVCTMYYHAAAGATDASPFDTTAVVRGGTMTTAWLKVDNGLGNSVYWNKEYNTQDVETDVLGFDKNATCFYWQNRLTHAFLALADYNQLTTNVGAVSATGTQGKLKMYPYGDEEFPELGARRYVNSYDLTRGTRTSMAQQPDPVLALTIMKPAGATQEANRARLYFRHQFSQIQVNLKSSDDNSANILASQIDKVELLGVSQEGYVCNRLMPDGTVGEAFGKDVSLDEFSDDVLEKNKWGTSFQMFDMATGADVDGDGQDDGYALGFLKSFNAIAFGHLWAIRITWFEGTQENKGAIHSSTFEVPATNETHVQLRELQSSIKYIYDLELRRGTLAVIRTQILNWDQKEDLVYGTDGTIFN